MRRARPRYESPPDDGLVLAGGRLWTPEQMSLICRRALSMMERHPGTRAQDEAERCSPRRVVRLQWWEPGR